MLIKLVSDFSDTFFIFLKQVFEWSYVFSFNYILYV